MRLQEIQPLKEYALEDNQGFAADDIAKVLDAKSQNQWSEGMSLEDALKHLGLDNGSRV